MGGRLSALRRRPAALATPAEGAGAATCCDSSASVCLVLRPIPDGSAVRVELMPRSPKASIPDEDLLVRVQLQASFSPSQAIHLILLPTDKQAQGVLSHNVDGWMGTPRKEGEEGAAEAQAAAERPRSPRSPRSRLAGKLSPRHKMATGLVLQ